MTRFALFTALVRFIYRCQLNLIIPLLRQGVGSVSFSPLRKLYMRAQVSPMV